MSNVLLKLPSSHQELLQLIFQGFLLCALLGSRHRLHHLRDRRLGPGHCLVHLPDDILRRPLGAEPCNQRMRLFNFCFRRFQLRLLLFHDYLALPQLLPLQGCLPLQAKLLLRRGQSSVQLVQFCCIGGHLLCYCVLLLCRKHFPSINADDRSYLFSLQRLLARLLEPTGLHGINVIRGEELCRLFCQLYLILCIHNLWLYLLYGYLSFPCTCTLSEGSKLLSHCLDSFRQLHELTYSGCP
mmetsp:Transcript_9851/g.20925  ORF Transcript_9851/g.20925 Transcript_9851/m.20925 type:complete len:241 (-) Transcript_9851:84-806(-)